METSESLTTNQADPAQPDQSFSEQLWSSIAPIYRAILAHPFLTGLTDGTLPEPVFRYYVVQDALYLIRYARALAIVAARAPEAADVAMFARDAADAVAGESLLHEGFFADLGLSPETVATTPLAPTNLAYTSYLLATAYGGSFADGLGAILPCYWIYWEVGKALTERGSPNPRYQRWIGAYGGEAYAATVRAVLTLTDRLGADLTPTQRASVTAHFAATSRYEWMFWDAAWRQETWPV